MLKREPEQRFQTAVETEEFLKRFEAHLRSPRRNRQPRLAGVKRSTNYARCLIAIAIASVFAISVMAFNQTGLVPMIKFISVRPTCTPAPATGVAEEQDDGEANKREDDTTTVESEPN